MNKKYQRIAVLICLSACSLPACSDDSAVTDDSSKNGACTAADNICFDNSTAQTCENGILYHKICAYGCENGTCQEPPKCTPADNACKDEKTLSICDETAGIMKERECEYGCVGNACALPCTAADNKCIDANTIQICKNGHIATKKCSDFGDSFVCATTNGIPDCHEALGITFELPANAEDDGILTFIPKVGKLDVVLNVDTPGSMVQTIYAIKKSFGDMIDNIRAIVPNSGFALSMFDDFPIKACTSSADYSVTCGSSRTNSNYSDLPLRVLGQVSTDETTINGYINNSLFRTRQGDDYPESGAEALYQLMTKAGVKWRSDTSSTSWTSLSFPPMDSDRWGGAGFRKDTLPVIIHISDAYSHDKSSSYNTSVKEWMAYKDGYIDTPHYTEHIVPKLKSTGTRIISLNFGYAAGDMYKQMTAWSRESNAVVPVCAFKTDASTWMCGENKCCLGSSAADPETVNGAANQCILKYTGAQNSVADYITQGVGALVKYGTFEAAAKVRGETMDNGKDTSCFIDYIEAYEYVAPTAAYEASCVPAAAPAMIQSESYNDGFKNFAIGSTANNQGAKLRFKVHAKNDGCYESSKETKAFLAYIDVYDPITGLVFDTQHVTVTVPGSL